MATIAAVWTYNPLKVIVESPLFDSFTGDLLYYMNFIDTDGQGGEWAWDPSIQDAFSTLRKHGYSVLSKSDEAKGKLNQACETLKEIFKEAASNGEHHKDD